MEQIYPLTEEVISRYCGMPVCAVMKNGLRYIGNLSECRNGRVRLDTGLNIPHAPRPEAGQAASQNEIEKEQQRTTGRSGAKRGKKSRKLKASSIKYEKGAPNPAAVDKNLAENGILQLDLQHIMFLVLIV